MNDGFTPLLIAARTGTTRSCACATLLDAGADKDLAMNGTAPPRCSSPPGLADVRALLDAGAGKDLAMLTTAQERTTLLSSQPITGTTRSCARCSTPAPTRTSRRTTACTPLYIAAHQGTSRSWRCSTPAPTRTSADNDTAHPAVHRGREGARRGGARDDDAGANKDLANERRHAAAIAAQRARRGRARCARRRRRHGRLGKQQRAPLALAVRALAVVSGHDEVVRTADALAPLKGAMPRRAVHDRIRRHGSQGGRARRKAAAI